MVMAFDHPLPLRGSTAVVVAQHRSLSGSDLLCRSSSETCTEKRLFVCQSDTSGGKFVWIVALFVAGALVSVIGVLRFQALMREMIDDLPDSITREPRYRRVLGDPRYSNALYVDLLLKKFEVTAEWSLLRKARRWFLAVVGTFVVIGLAIVVLSFA